MEDYALIRRIRKLGLPTIDLLHEEGVKSVLVTVIADLTMVERAAFWGVLDNHKWVYPYDAKGERHHFKDIPKTVADLKDDPFRSLAGELRRVGSVGEAPRPQAVAQRIGHVVMAQDRADLVEHLVHRVLAPVMDHPLGQQTAASRDDARHPPRRPR